jgi:plasmid stabilization system protein ParE
MTREDIVRIAQEAGIGNSWDLNWHDPTIERFANLVAEAERKKLQGQIETLGAMYELASKQRDALMDEQRAQVATWRAEHATTKAENT